MLQGNVSVPLTATQSSDNTTLMFGCSSALSEGDVVPAADSKDTADEKMDGEWSRKRPVNGLRSLPHSNSTSSVHQTSTIWGCIVGFYGGYFYNGSDGI